MIFNMYCVKGAILLGPRPRCPWTFFLGQCVPWMMCPCTIHSLRLRGGVWLFWVVLGWDCRGGGRAYFIQSICRVRWSSPWCFCGFLLWLYIVCMWSWVRLHRGHFVQEPTLSKGRIVKGNVLGHIGHGHIVIASWIVLSSGNSEVSDGLLCLSFPWMTCTYFLSSA